MAPQYLNIEEIPEKLQNKVHQNLAFRTGAFIWKIQFNVPLNPSTVNATNMYLTSEDGEMLKTKIRYDIQNNAIEIAPMEPYAEGRFYYLNITTKVRSRGGQKLKEPIKVKFKL